MESVSDSKDNSVPNSEVDNIDKIHDLPSSTISTPTTTSSNTYVSHSETSENKHIPPIPMNLSSSSSSSSTISLPSTTAVPSFRASSNIIQAPILLSNGIEYSIHSIPKSMRQDIALVFSGLPNMIQNIQEYYTIPTCQKAICDLANWGNIAAIEKDLLLERFTAWSQTICTYLQSHQYWGDYIDPCSGLPVQTPYCTVVYPEVDAFETLLHYKSYNAGGCKIISHPVWKTNMYPASLFVRAPLNIIQDAIQYATEHTPMKPRINYEEQNETDANMTTIRKEEP